MSTPLTWRRVTTGLDFPEDVVYRAVTPDGYTLEACYLEAFGPYARAIAPGSRDAGYDTVAFTGADTDEIIRNGKRKALQLLDELRQRKERT